MNSSSDITFVKGSLRYKRAPEVGIDITIPLSGKIKELDNFFRQRTVNLADVYEAERQSSNLYVPLSKFQFIFSNSYYGKAQEPNNPYGPFNNNLYYYNVEQTKELSFLSTNPIQWPGFPQYNEFTFIRTDNNITGYTAPPNEHILFVNSAATFYNWYYYITYASENNYSRVLKDSTLNLQWTPADGIPFVMNLVQFNGREMWQFTCPVKHNLTTGEFVKLENLIIQNSLGAQVTRDMTFEVYSLGDGTFNSEQKIFNILDLGFNTGPNTFENGQVGNFFRIVDSENPIESKSEYYIRKHKVLTKWEDAIVTNSGFEQNAFRTDKKFQTTDLTPNQSAFVAVKEDSQSYNISFNGSIDVSNILDNQGRPVTELFVTIVNRGYFGYFNQNVTGSYSLKQGWDFNLSSFSQNSLPDSWWSNLNLNGYVGLEYEGYTKTFNNTNYNFYYNKNYNVGDLMDGDLCEWNDITQQETVLSETYHKFFFNSGIFQIEPATDNPKGYYYRPFFKIQLKVYSDYVEEGEKDTAEDVPFYSYFSRNNNSFIWRDLYTIGFIDGNGNGINYPFMNNRHYPYNNYIFRIIPEGTNVGNIYDIQTPIIDDCE